MKKPKVRGIFSGERGQRTFNILYSIGASIVILGALFKMIHMDGADFMLVIGMGTEAVIFFLSAFDEKQTGVVTHDEHEEAERKQEPAPTAQPQPVVEVHSAVYEPIDSKQIKNITTATDDYVRQLNELNATLSTLQMSLAKNMQGLNAMYELQLRDASAQLDSVGKAQREMNQMTENIKQLNAIYERMLSAMQNR